MTFPGVRLVMDACDDSLFFSVPFAGAVIGCRRYIAVVIDKTVPHARTYAGMAGEWFVLAAGTLGLGTCWVSGSFRRRHVQVETGKNEKVVAVIALGVPAEEIRGVRRRKSLSEICRSDPAAWPIWAFNAAEYVRIAPSAINRQPWRFAFAGRSLMLLRIPMADDLDMGIALLHMLIALEGRPFHLAFGEDKEAACLVAEDKAE